MVKNIFLLLGGNRLNFGILNKFKQKNYKVFVIDWNEHPQMAGDKHYRLDVKNPDLIIQALQQDGYWEQVAFAYSSIDLAVSSVAKINKAIGLRTISDEGLKYSSSKSMMTAKWQEAGLLNRISKKYEQMHSEILDFNNSYKIIIKPDNSASSRGITILEKNSNEELIEQAFKKAQDEASNNIVVVEEFVEGTEFTVEMIGDDYGNVSVYGISHKTHTKNAINNKIAVKLHYNAVSDELQHKIAETAIKCYKALGFSASLGHLEILLKEDGTLSPVEIGARSSGFIASDLVDIVSGSDFLGDLINVQNGMPVINGLHPQTEKSSLYFFYDFPAGSIVKKSLNFTNFLESSIISRYSNRSNLVEGHRFDNVDNDNARVGYEILEGRKSVMTIDYIKRQEQQMLAEMLEDKVFFDAHIHHKAKENGGFIVGLEGKPYFEGTLSNKEVLSQHSPENNYIAFYYVSNSEKLKIIKHKYLKYHPRREKYTPDEVIESISLNKPKCVMIDTLNEPYWVPYDYWKIAGEFPDLPFIFPHSGGYLINDFIKICHFQKNIWIDFALTHTSLGHLGNKKGLPYINQAIEYALEAPFAERVLLSSDYPFFSQEDVVAYYEVMNKKHFLNQNFINLLEKIK